MKKPRVTISIALYGELPYTKRCLKALFKNTPEDLYKLVLFDNDSKDDTFEYLASGRDFDVPEDKVKLSRSKKNVGFGLAHNYVAKNCDTELLLLLNNDTIPLKGWLEPMVAVMDKYPDCEVVGSKLISPLINGIQHAGIVFDGITPIHRYFGQAPNASMVNQRQEFPAVTGACFLVRTKTFNEGPSEKYPFKTAGFDPEYFCGWEDVDYCLQMQKMNRKVIYEPKSVLYHYEGQSEGRLAKEDENRTYFYKQWLPEIRVWVKKAHKEMEEKKEAYIKKHKGEYNFDINKETKDEIEHNNPDIQSGAKPSVNTNSSEKSDV